MTKEIQALFHVTPNEPYKIVEGKFDVYLYLYGVFVGPRPLYSLKEQYELDYAIIRSTRFNKSDITQYANQGCVRIRFIPKEPLTKKPTKEKTQIQFIFRLKRKYIEDEGTNVQVYLWNDKVIEEEIQFRENPDNGEDFISFITEIPEIKKEEEGEGAIEIFLRPYTQDVYTLQFFGVTAYLHD